MDTRAPTTAASHASNRRTGSARQMQRDHGPRCAEPARRHLRRGAARSELTIAAQVLGYVAMAILDRPLRELVRTAAGFSVGVVVARLVAFAAVPIYLRFLAPAEFAIQAIALVTEQVLVIIAGYAVTNAMGRYFFEERH